jgi:predicted membrane-bound spermidine synthase
MNTPNFEDRLEWLGILVGAFVIVVGIGSLSGLPWTTAESTLAAGIQVVGIFGIISVGIVLVLFAYTGDVTDLFSRGDGA